MAITTSCFEGRFGSGRGSGSGSLSIADKLKRDMASPELAQQIRKNLKLADALGIRGTPAFVIGDKVVPGAADIATLKSMVADAHNK
jgi:protein-disulfide isomerase